MPNNTKRPKKLSRTTIYESEWINLHTDRVEFPDGRIIEKLHVLDYLKEAVGVIVLNDKKEVLLEYAYRYHKTSCRIVEFLSHHTVS